jgi:cyclohexanecarboxyl-CoA dehydrogenase
VARHPSPSCLHGQLSLERPCNSVRAAGAGQYDILQYQALEPRRCILVEFGFTEEQAAFREAVWRLARREIAPGYLDRARQNAFPWRTHRQLADLGVLALLAGPEHSPASREDYVAVGLVVEELAYADVNVANAVLPVLLTSSLLAAYGTPEVRGRWLEPLVTGETLVAFGLTEPHTGSDAGALAATAVADGGGYVLTGEKTSVTMLGHAEAMVVTARTVRDGEPAGVSAFLVDLSSDGISTSDIPDGGFKPMGRGVLHLDGVRVPAEALLGAEGSAFRSVLAGFDFTRPLLALTGVGCAQSCIDDTVAYVGDRESFGEPLARYEGVSFPLAEHTTMLEAARLLCYQALWRRAEGREHTADAAMAK